jgi:tRNA-binding EMAP/Myf-like protein
MAERRWLEVEGIEDPAQKLKGFRVAKILTAARTPMPTSCRC